MTLDLQKVSRGFSDSTKKARPASKSDIAQIKKLIDTNSMQTIAKQLNLPHKEVKKIVAKLKLI